MRANEAESYGSAASVVLPLLTLYAKDERERAVMTDLARKTEGLRLVSSNAYGVTVESRSPLTFAWWAIQCERHVYSKRVPDHETLEYKMN